MPPKPKFTREEMVEAALELVARRGAEALTARELGAALGSSARPIFTVFRSMDELQQAVREAAMRRFEQFVRQPVANMPVFKQVGLQMVRFAMQEPKLYQLLFMQENADTAGFEDMFRALGGAAAALPAGGNGSLYEKDAYGAYTICNIYYDTGDWRLIRKSLEKTVYKEKLRIRSYGVPTGDDKVFVELKKKYDGVVYKRRVAMTAAWRFFKNGSVNFL